MAAHRTLRIVLTAALAFGGLRPATADDGASPGVHVGRIVLGQSAKLSGSGGTQAGVQYRDGLLLAFNAANAAGGVHGRRIELISLDDGNKADTAAANTRSLIDQHRVFALVGHTFTAPVKAALPLVRERSIPFIAPYTGFPELYDGSHRNVFMFRASFEDELALLARHIDTVAFQRVGLIHYGTPVGEELRRDVGHQLKRFGRDLVASASMPINPRDPRQAAQGPAMALARNCPNVMILGVSGKDAAAFVSAMKAHGCPSIQYLARGLVDIAVLTRELGADARGIMVSQPVPNPFRASAHPLVQEYELRLRQRNGASTAPDFVEFEGFIVGKFVVQALRRAGHKLDRRAFVQALEAERLEGPGHYRLQFGPGRRVGTQYVNFVMISEQGRIVD
ncbi:ABC transporter substrate-binding protein [Piscinibacter sp. HJYY11]|uniref:ABC transporter substrate-binding protein n=1 Tax=Piscinibacter sp. HJYY11 TaxID=2801333 RepID=UPI00191EA0E5|nr:ABC transporter substrate-binding protein [Piscinibacter sp. HJYY11]MBL0728362.1 ABC transporter substrate-binding protein [Piscinibacter sp. HJYY11]